MMLTAQMPSPHPWAAVLLLVNDEDVRMFIQFPVPAFRPPQIEMQVAKASTMEAFAFLGSAYLRNPGACQIVMELPKAPRLSGLGNRGHWPPAQSLRLQGPLMVPKAP